MQKLPDGPGSLFEQDLKAQIAAAKWTMARRTPSPSELEETYFGGTSSTAPERVDPAVDAAQATRQRFGLPPNSDSKQN